MVTGLAMPGAAPTRSARAIRRNAASTLLPAAASASAIGDGQNYLDRTSWDFSSASIRRTAVRSALVAAAHSWKILIPRTAVIVPRIVLTIKALSIQA